jgi:D-alanyl-lipoteichoic acid acyltransferase DltB (MBOAT superfamily)
MMAIGFFKKMFIADNISPMVNALFNYPLGHESFTIILGTIAFGVQIYSDFSGYSDIAIGAALIMGFKIPLNFSKPYFAISPSDFWRRWHISLSSWLRDYLYIPLGGSKKSKPRTYFNLMAVMFLGGLWHGASWNFVLWGVLHGGYLIIHKFIVDNTRRFGFSKTSTRLIMILSIIITQYFIFLAWIPFRVSDTNYLLYCIYKYIVLDFQTIKTTQFILSYKIPILIMLFFFVIHFISYKKGGLVDPISRFKNKYWFLFLLGVATLILFFYNGNPEQFLYFKF